MIYAFQHKPIEMCVDCPFFNESHVYAYCELRPHQVIKNGMIRDPNCTMREIPEDEE